MEKTDTSLPLDFPPLLALAEANVRANWPIEEQTRTRFGYDPRGDTLDDYCAEIRAFFIGCEADRLRDLTRRDSQAAWLGWLAREVGMELPPVGYPGWTYYGASLYLLGKDSPPKDRKGHVFDFGGEFPEFTKCPRLLDPKANPIRALMQAVLTVGSRGGA